MTASKRKSMDKRISQAAIRSANATKRHTKLAAIRYQISLVQEDLGYCKRSTDHRSRQLAQLQQKARTVENLSDGEFSKMLGQENDDRRRKAENRKKKMEKRLAAQKAAETKKLKDEEADRSEVAVKVESSGYNENGSEDEDCVEIKAE